MHPINQEFVLARISFLKKIRSASHVSMVEITYGEIEDGIKEDLNL